MIIAKIRALAKNSSPQMAIVDINSVIKDAIALFRHGLDDDRILLRHELSGQSTPVMGDRTQLQQVIINVIMNSVDAMRDFTDRAREITVRSSRTENGKIVVEISDSGSGVDPQQVEKLFQPFYTTKPKGLGMGLSISRSIVEAHDGNLNMSSNPEIGTTVHITLPGSSVPKE
jgi:signal transduction histidine kinase